MSVRRAHFIVKFSILAYRHTSYLMKFLLKIIICILKVQAASNYAQQQLALMNDQIVGCQGTSGPQLTGW